MTAASTWPAGMTQERADRYVNDVLPDAKPVSSVSRRPPFARDLEIVRRDADTVANPRFPILTDIELENEPDGECIVDGVLPHGGLAVLWGESSSYKTFVAVHLAACIATGLDWHGHHVLHCGRVVIVLAEGVSGMRKRIAAWKLHYGQSGTSINVLFLRSGVDLLDERAMRAFGESILELGDPPVAVVFDTLAGCFFNGDENATADMVRAVHCMRALSRQLDGATMVPVHHSGWSQQDRMRGSYALYAAAEVVIKVTANARAITLDCARPGGKEPRDFEPFPPVRCAVAPVAESLAIIAGEGAIATPEELSANERKAIATLSEVFFENGATFSDWLKASGIPEGTFPRVRKALCARHLAERFRVGKKERYRATSLGQAALAINCRRAITPLSRPASQSAITLSPPLRGDSADSVTDSSTPRVADEYEAAERAAMGNS